MRITYRGRTLEKCNKTTLSASGLQPYSQITLHHEATSSRLYGGMQDSKAAAGANIDEDNRSLSQLLEECGGLLNDESQKSGINDEMSMFHSIQQANPIAIDSLEATLE